MTIIGTRGSPLALAQTELVIAALCALHPGATFETRRITTRGDQIQDRPLSQVGGKGLFVKEIEEALLSGAIDMAVHSLKDLPAEQPAGLVIAAYPERADPRDVLVSRDGRPLAELAAGARVGTSSLRRSVQLQALRPDIEVANIRGNVDTRLRKLDEGQYDAIVVAAAGLDRLGLHDRATEFFEPAFFLPAPGQGALAVEVRAGAAEMLALLGALDHGPTRVTVEAERAFLQRLEGGCAVPFAAHARLDGDVLTLRGMLADEDGGNMVVASTRGPASRARRLGHDLADDVRALQEEDRVAGVSFY
ncbi:MAG TPA: hydroxymethylbilane synthase [Ardenticatenaceae bacterium]|nr:hydroxymethylbilane synthase [Ardenticatenaceae bacterium]